MNYIKLPKVIYSQTPFPAFMKSNWIVFAIAITLIFVPMVFLGVNTFFPKEPNGSECNYITPMKSCTINATDACLKEQEAANQKSMECYNRLEEERTRYDGLKYITIMVICLIASFVMLTRLDKSILYGLFAGVVLSAFIGTIRYISARSILGFGLLVLLFIVVIYFIQRDRKKP
jgi:hypothetical protein